MKKLNNKGFSLVELIIVIAIMVILVAVLSPVFTKYVERGRKSTDIQSASEIATAVQTALVDPFPPAGTTTPSDGVFDGDYISDHGIDSVTSAPKVKSTDKAAGASVGHAGEFFYVDINDNDIKVYAGNSASAPLVFPTQDDPYNK